VDFLTDSIAEEAVCIVHFYDENSNKHQAIDYSVLEDMAKKFPGCKFYRMDFVAIQDQEYSKRVANPRQKGSGPNQ
jgi:hypothetical protein